MPYLEKPQITLHYHSCEIGTSCYTEGGRFLTLAAYFMYTLQNVDGKKKMYHRVWLLQAHAHITFSGKFLCAYTGKSFHAYIRVQMNWKVEPFSIASGMRTTSLEWSRCSALTH